MASPLWEQIREHRLEITPPRGDALREAIALPARDVGVQLEPELVERLLADAGDEPGVLPFVQETLVMLWAHADRYVIGLDAYTDLVGDKSGRSGLQVALAEHAEHVYRDVLANDGERAVAQRILLRLHPVWRRPPRHAAAADGGRAAQGSGEQHGVFDKVLAALTANRLLTLSDEARRVDLSHEALIRGWPRLHEWIDAAPCGRADAAAAGGEGRRAPAAAPGRRRQAGCWMPWSWPRPRRGCKGPDAAELGVSDELAGAGGRQPRAIDAAVLEKEQAAERLRKRNQGLAIALAAALVGSSDGCASVYASER